jgi:hypothetical protein
MSKIEANWKALVERRDELKGIRGKPIGDEPADEAEHFYRCATRGQAVDSARLVRGAPP